MYHEVLSTRREEMHMKTRHNIILKSKTNSHTSKPTSKLIAEQISVFLKAGGKITKIRPGDAGKKAFLDEEET